MPGVYTSYMKVGQLCVPCEIHFIPTEVTDAFSNRSVTTSKWVEHKHWKDIQQLLKPLVEDAVKYHADTTDSWKQLPPTIKKGALVSFGARFYLNHSRGLPLNDNSLDEAEQNYIWTDDEDEDENSRIRNSGERYQRYQVSRVYIRACIHQHTAQKQGIEDSERSIAKALGVNCATGQHCFQKGGNQHPEVASTTTSEPFLNHASSSSGALDLEQLNVERFEKVIPPKPLRLDDFAVDYTVDADTSADYQINEEQLWNLPEETFYEEKDDDGEDVNDTYGKLTGTTNRILSDEEEELPDIPDSEYATPISFSPTKSPIEYSMANSKTRRRLNSGSNKMKVAKKARNIKKSSSSLKSPRKKHDDNNLSARINEKRSELPHSSSHRTSESLRTKHRKSGSCMKLSSHEKENLCDSVSRQEPLNSHKSVSSTTPNLTTRPNCEPTPVEVENLSHLPSVKQTSNLSVPVSLQRKTKRRIRFQSENEVQSKPYLPTTSTSNRTLQSLSVDLNPDGLTAEVNSKNSSSVVEKRGRSTQNGKLHPHSTDVQTEPISTEVQILEEKSLRKRHLKRLKIKQEKVSATAVHSNNEVFTLPERDPEMPILQIAILEEVHIDESCPSPLAPPVLMKTFRSIDTKHRARQRRFSDNLQTIGKSVRRSKRRSSDQARDSLETTKDDGTEILAIIPPVGGNYVDDATNSADANINVLDKISQAACTAPVAVIRSGLRSDSEMIQNPTSMDCAEARSLVAVPAEANTTVTQFLNSNPRNSYDITQDARNLANFEIASESASTEYKSSASAPVIGSKSPALVAENKGEKDRAQDTALAESLLPSRSPSTEDADITDADISNMASENLIHISKGTDCDFTDMISADHIFPESLLEDVVLTALEVDASLADIQQQVEEKSITETSEVDPLHTPEGILPTTCRKARKKATATPGKCRQKHKILRTKDRAINDNSVCDSAQSTEVIRDAVGTVENNIGTVVEAEVGNSIFMRTTDEQLSLNSLELVQAEHAKDNAEMEGVESSAEAGLVLHQQSFDEETVKDTESSVNPVEMNVTGLVIDETLNHATNAVPLLVRAQSPDICTPTFSPSPRKTPVKINLEIEKSLEPHVIVNSYNKSLTKSEDSGTDISSMEEETNVVMAPSASAELQTPASIQSFNADNGDKRDAITDSLKPKSELKMLNEYNLPFPVNFETLSSHVSIIKHVYWTGGPTLHGKVASSSLDAIKSAYDDDDLDDENEDEDALPKQQKSLAGSLIDDEIGFLNGLYNGHGEEELSSFMRLDEDDDPEKEALEIKQELLFIDTNESSDDSNEVEALFELSSSAPHLPIPLKREVHCSSPPYEGYYDSCTYPIREDDDEEPCSRPCSSFDAATRSSSDLRDTDESQSFGLLDYEKKTVYDVETTSSSRNFSSVSDKTVVATAVWHDNDTDSHNAFVRPNSRTVYCTPLGEQVLQGIDPEQEREALAAAGFPSDITKVSTSHLLRSGGVLHFSLNELNEIRNQFEESDTDNSQPSTSKALTNKRSRSCKSEQSTSKKSRKRKQNSLESAIVLKKERSGSEPCSQELDRVRHKLRTAGNALALNELRSRLFGDALNTYVPRGDEFDMSQSSQCMTVFFGDYPQRTRKYKMWKSMQHCYNIGFTLSLSSRLAQMMKDHEVVEQLTRKHKQTLLKLLEENYDDLPDAVTRRAKLFWNSCRNSDADSKKKLMDMSTVGPFSYDQVGACLDWIESEFDDILNKRLTQPQMTTYVTKVLIPTVVLLLFNEVTEISLDATEKVLHDEATADIDWESVLEEQPSQERPLLSIDS